MVDFSDILTMVLSVIAARLLVFIGHVIGRGIKDIVNPDCEEDKTEDEEKR